MTVVWRAKRSLWYNWQPEYLQERQCTTVNSMTSSVSPKGQVTIPQPIRERLGIKPRDRVVFRLEGNAVRIEPVKSWLADSFQSVPALDPPRSWTEIEEIAHGEHARHAAREGLDEA